MTARWFLRRRAGLWHEVTKAEWIQAERNAGFRGGHNGEPSTAGWGHNGMEGRFTEDGSVPPGNHAAAMELERRLTTQEERFQRFLETNELWDGS